MSARDELAGIISGVVHGPSDGTRLTRSFADAILAAGYSKPEIIGYVVVDKSSGSLDWDDQMYPSEEACIDSLCGPYQDFTRETASECYWGNEYKLCPVLTPKAQS